MHPRATTFLAERDPADGAPPHATALPREELERELAEIETALAKASTNLDLAEMDHQRWALLLDRAHRVLAAIPPGSPDDPRHAALAASEVQDIAARERAAYRRVEGCRASLEALGRVRHVIGERIGAAVGHPRRASGVRLRRR